jgi:hypothetical protein
MSSEVRMVEETVEDIMFLARGLELGLQPEHHEYLASQCGMLD